MNEALLHYIWKFRLFQMNGLITVCGKQVQVIHPGIHNHDQGPDFIHARLKIEGTHWAGSVELHVCNSHWTTHQHAKDPNYRNIILHVVWMNDKAISLPFPTLELSLYVAKSMLDRYKLLMCAKHFIPCQHLLKEVNPLQIRKVLERCLVERLESRADEVIALTEKENGDWQTILFRLLFRTMGGKVNGFSFEQLLQSLPYGIIRKARGNPIKLEAIFFGQSNMLNRSLKDEWPLMLKDMYDYEQQKNKLIPAVISMHYFRMRPMGFPTIRLSILAHLLADGAFTSQSIFDATASDDIRQLLPIKVTDYWKFHYRFDVPTRRQVLFSEKSIQDKILINAIIPFLYSYGRQTHQSVMQEKAMNWLEELRAESNLITKTFHKLGAKAEHAGESQGMLQLYKDYCEKKDAWLVL